jgi:hypothetical protein
MERFKATLESVRQGHAVLVPEAVAAAAGLGHRARVRGTIDGVAYRAGLMKASGAFFLGVHKATITAAGARVGAEVLVTLELDPEPLPTDTVPADLRRAIDASPRAKAGWTRQSPSHRREHARHVLDAKKADTRARRIAKLIEDLEALEAADAKGVRAPKKKTRAAKASPRRR